MKKIIVILLTAGVILSAVSFSGCSRDGTAEFETEISAMG